MRELAKEIARNALLARPGGSPTVTDLYHFFLRCFDNDAQAAEGALAQYLEGKLPDEVGKCIQQAVEMATHPKG
jgi:hypothetical protein